MKNILIYVSPDRSFDLEHFILAKIQIDNSLSLGWKKQDIMLFTNFNYEYNGILSRYIPDETFCAIRPLGTKTTALAYLLTQDRLPKDELYWIHDFDAYQLNPFTEEELGVKEAGFTTYGWSERWCMGSFFTRGTTGDVFSWIVHKIYRDGLIDEKALLRLTETNYHNINSRYQKLNITYNLGMRHTDIIYNMADKPLKVIHFHPHHREIDTLKIFWPLMTDRLKGIFTKYGIG